MGKGRRLNYSLRVRIFLGKRKREVRVLGKTRDYPKSPGYYRDFLSFLLRREELPIEVIGGVKEEDLAELNKVINELEV